MKENTLRSNSGAVVLHHPGSPSYRTLLLSCYSLPCRICLHHMRLFLENACSGSSVPYDSNLLCCRISWLRTSCSFSFERSNLHHCCIFSQVSSFINLADSRTPEYFSPPLCRPTSPVLAFYRALLFSFSDTTLTILSSFLFAA